MPVASGNTIGIIPDVRGLGGPASFNHKFSTCLQKRGIQVSYDITRDDLKAILVIAGSKHLDKLSAARRKHIPIIQRLDGMNFVHRRKFTGMKHFLRSEINNWIMQTIRSRLANRIIYQSWFSQQWWQREYGALDKPIRVIHNGINLEEYHPSANVPDLSNGVRLLTVEGHLKNGVETGLFNAVQSLQYWKEYNGKPVRLVVAGDVPVTVRSRAEALIPGRIDWLGILPRESIPVELQKSHLFFSVELNPACPNAVIEALACGVPVVAFDSGAISELVDTQSGGIIPYDRDVWKLELANGSSLPETGSRLLADLQNFRINARNRAESLFNLEDMVNAYLDFMIL